jgi:hypothetical protein
MREVVLIVTNCSHRRIVDASRDNVTGRAVSGAGMICHWGADSDAELGLESANTGGPPATDLSGAPDVTAL